MCMKLRCDNALMIIRIALGAIFIAHGSQKVLGLFGGAGLAGFAAWLGTFGVPPIIAYLAAFAELFGGILLLSGYYAWLGGLLTSAVMAGAIFIIHWPHFFVQNNGFEYPLMLIITTIATLLGGSSCCRMKNEDACCKEAGSCGESNQSNSNCC